MLCLISNIDAFPYLMINLPTPDDSAQPMHEDHTNPTPTSKCGMRRKKGGEAGREEGPGLANQ